MHDIISAVSAHIFLLQLERWFTKALKEKRKFVIKKMNEDGACLFRAVGRCIREGYLVVSKYSYVGCATLV